ncbi:MAG: flagellar hook-length control protein FliK [Syntrophomonas sp.]
MNGVQATMLAATAAPVEAGVVLANQSSKSVRDSSSTRSSFERQLKKACQVPRDNSPSSNEVQEKSDPMKAETGQTEENQVEQVKDQSSEVKLDEDKNTEKTGDNTSGTDAQGSTSTGTVMAIPFIGLVKVDSNPLQQEIQAGAGGAVVNAPANPEVRLSSDANLEMPQLVGQTIEAVNTAKTDSPATQPSSEPQTAILVVNDETRKASAKMKNAGETVPVDAQSQTVDKLGVGREASELENHVQVMDDKTVKKTEADAGSATGKKLAEFESHRFSVVRPAQDSNQAEGQQQSSSDGEDTTNSLVLQQVEVEIPKVQVRNVPTSVQNSRAVVDPQDLMDQVVKKAEVMIKDNSSEMTLQLKPGFLGKMTIKIAVDEAGTVTAHFSTSSQQVKNVLEQNIQALRHNLEAQGMKVDRTEVNVQLDSGGMMSDPGGRQDLWQQPRGIPFFGFSDSEDEIAPIASQPVSSVQSDAYDTVEASDGYNFLV